MSRFASILLVALVGCGKKPESAPVAAEQTQEPVAASRPPVATESDAPLTQRPPVNIVDQLQGTIHPEMTMRLQMFVQIKGRLPESFYELQNMPGFDSTPGLPPAFKYEIDPKDKTVKIVRK